MAADRTPIAERARGRWRGILQHLGVDGRLLDGKRRACPVCRTGKDRFRFDDREQRGTFYCTKCGAGDGVKLVMMMRGCDFKAAAEEIEGVIGEAPLEPRRKGRSAEDERRALNEMWRGSAPIIATDAAGLFLRKRAGVVAYPEALRFKAKCRYDDRPPTWHPAMLAMVQAPDGKPVNLHRTYLTEAGDKADLDDPRRTMPGSLPAGCAVRLFPEAEDMGVAEGIETAFAAASLFGMPVWSTLNANRLAVWSPPPIARRITIFGDHDPKFAGQAAAHQLAHRLATLADPPEVVVRLPEEAGKDWRDVLMEQPV